MTDLEYLNDDDELGWLERMRRRGSLNQHGKDNLKVARSLKRERERE